MDDTKRRRPFISRKLGYSHQRVLQSEKGNKTDAYLPMVHRIVSNLKRWLLGTHQGALLPRHLPAYLNEFTFRFNRRFWRGPAFHRALGLMLLARNRPEYDTLYRVAKGGAGAWIHPNSPADTTPPKLGERGRPWLFHPRWPLSQGAHFKSLIYNNIL